jgi:hypothetical protein
MVAQWRGVFANSGRSERVKNAFRETFLGPKRTPNSRQTGRRPQERRPSSRRDGLAGNQFSIELQAYPNMVNIRNFFARINQVKF